MADPPINGIQMVVYLTEVDFSKKYEPKLLKRLNKRSSFFGEKKYN